MKVVRRGNTGPFWIGHRVTCESCNAKIELEKGDDVKFVADPRDGDYYEFECPECKGNITMDTTLFRQSSAS